MNTLKYYITGMGFWKGRDFLMHPVVVGGGAGLEFELVPGDGKGFAWWRRLGGSLVVLPKWARLGYVCLFNSVENCLSVWRTYEGEYWEIKLER